MSTALTAPYSAVPILQFLQRRSKLCILFDAWVKVICILFYVYMVLIGLLMTYEESLRKAASGLRACHFSLFLVTSDISPMLISHANWLRF